MPTISTNPGTSTGDAIWCWSLASRRLAPILWRLFTLLYRHRSDVIDDDRLHDELYREMEQPVVAKVVKENVRRLRRALADSRYEIVNHPTLGYELIVRDEPRLGHDGARAG